MISRRDLVAGLLATAAGTAGSAGAARHEAGQDAEVTLVKDGAARSVILIPDDAPAPVRYGAAQLQHFLAAMSGAKIPIRTPGATAGYAAAIQLQSDSSLGSEEFAIHATGNDRGGAVVIRGGGDRGVLYGCFYLLDEMLGCRWFTQTASLIPRRSSIGVPVGDVRQKPAFEYREPYAAECFVKEWTVRNRLNGSHYPLDASVGGRVEYGPYFVHTFSVIIPPEKYFASHPEYFSMVNGKRMNGYAQLCLTNPDVLRITIDTVKDWIRKNPQATIFSVSQNDTYYFCQCPLCKAIDDAEGAPSGSLLRFVNAVAAAIGKEYPHVLIDTLAYQWSEDPPRITRPLPNVRIRLAPIGACVAHAFDGCPANSHVYANLQAWSAITGQLYMWHYSTNFAAYLQPLPNLNEIGADLPLMKKHGVVGVFYEGDYARGGGGFDQELNSYLMARLMWDPTRAPGPIIREYLRGVYGAGAKGVQRWLTRLHQPSVEHGVDAHIYDGSGAAYLAPATLLAGDADLVGAAAAARPGEHREAVERARLGIQYTRLVQKQPAYAVTGEEYAPEIGPDYQSLESAVTQKIHRYGITQIREGQEVSHFFNWLAGRRVSYPLNTLQDARLRVDVVPALGCRLLSLIDKRFTRNLLQPARLGDDGYPASGGYEESLSAGYHGPGWNAAFVVASAGSDHLSAHAVVGALHVQRSLRLSATSLVLTTTVENRSESPQTVTLRTRPQFAAAPGAVWEVDYKEANGASLKLPRTVGNGKPRDTITLPNTPSTIPDGAWSVNLGDSVVAIQFDLKQVAEAVYDRDTAQGRVNLELVSVPWQLEPGDRATFTQTWTVSS
ncbi:MAG: DUF4838 domain-containing protein [Armatimonadetes bacterium]|nr:DUF4838 domain-containing protein [Armatimonadota bacterium]MDE2205254.1 DUF4838 domain-containing protein [Armatimonadota bacterium]